jgi:branched-chain amino acid transport system substrate-binding protein
MKRILLVLMVIALIAGLVLSSCATTPNPITPAASSSTSSASSSQPALADKILKIGMVGRFGSGDTLNWMRAVKLLVELDNNNGGITIGGEKYKIEIIDYDNNNSQSTEVAAINRLVYQDGVKYIITEGTFESGWLPVTEQNKVIVMNANVNYNISNLTMYKYSFNGCGTNAALSSVTGWFAKTYPEKAKTLTIAFPDNQLGHIFNDMFGGTWRAFGVNPKAIYFPDNQQDLSALGTRVASENPGMFIAMGGGATADGLIVNAVTQAGYKGQIMAVTQTTVQSLNAAFSPQALEGFMCGATSFDFDPPLTQAAIDFKNAWVAQYGGWEGPDVVFAESYDCLKAAWTQGGSVDTEKAAAVLSVGLKYNSINGPMQMISRPDLGNDRTTDSVQTYYVKRIHNGVAELVAEITTEESLSYMQLAFPPLPPGATPPGLPAAGPGPGGPGPGGPGPGGPGSGGPPPG